MATKHEPAQLAVQQTNYPQSPVGQPVVLAPGQQLVYPGQQGPVHMQATSVQQPPPYQVAGGVQANQGQAGVIHQQPGFNLSMDLNYLKSQPGIFKCVEILVLLLAFSTALKSKEFYDKPRWRTTNPQLYSSEKLEFFLGATISGWVMCILIVLAFLFGMNKNCGVPTNSVVLVTLFHMAWIIMLGGGTGALTYRADWFVDQIHEAGGTLSQLSGPDKTEINCLFAAVAFGYLAFFLFIADALLHYKFYTAMTTPPQFSGVVPIQPGPQYPGIQQVVTSPYPGDQQDFVKQPNA